MFLNQEIAKFLGRLLSLNGVKLDGMIEAETDEKEL